MIQAKKKHLTVLDVCKLEQKVCIIYKIMHTFNNRMTSQVCFN